MSVFLKVFFTTWILLFVAAVFLAVCFGHPAFAPPAVKLFIRLVFGGTVTAAIGLLVFILIAAIWNL